MKLNELSHADLVAAMRKRAEIRRSITTRKSAQEGKPDRIADILEEAAQRIELMAAEVKRRNDDDWGFTPVGFWDGED